jgi:hypothetical protein
MSWTCKRLGRDDRYSPGTDDLTQIQLGEQEGNVIKAEY